MTMLSQTGSRIISMTAATLFVLPAIAHAERSESKPAMAESDIVWVPAEAGSYRLNVSRSFPTDLWFESEVIDLEYTNSANFLVRKKSPTRVTIRPKPGATDGTIGSLSIVTESLKLAVMLRVVKNPENAKLQRLFKLKPASGPLQITDADLLPLLQQDLYRLHFRRYMRRHGWTLDHLIGEGSQCHFIPFRMM